jgi:hypothetical protein
MVLNIVGAISLMIGLMDYNNDEYCGISFQ